MSDDKSNNPFSVFKKRSHASSPVKSGGEFKKKFLRAQKATRRFPSFAQWTHLPRLLNKSEKRLFSGASVLTVLSIVAILIWGYTANLTVIPANGGSYTEGLIGSPQFINPLYSSANSVDEDIAGLVYSGLMKWDPQAGLIPDLAESYTISDDETVYTFSLRSDATWHDGTPVSPRDVIFTFSALKSPEYRSPLLASFRGVAIEQVDERTVSFILEDSFAPFLSTLTVGIMPADYWGDLDPQTTRLAERNLIPIGSGPYEFSEFEKDKRGVIQSYTLKRYPKYYGGPAHVDDITFKFYTTVEAGLEAIKSKRVEGLAVVPKDRVEEIMNSSLQVVSPHLPQTTAIFFNIKRGLLSDEALRKALGTATDKDAIVKDVLKGEAAVTHTPVASNYEKDTDAYKNPTPFNIDQARTQLNELGWTLHEGEEIRRKGDTVLELTITTIDEPETIAVANKIVEQWRLAGVGATVRSIDPQVFRNEILVNRDYDILLSGILMGSDPDLYPFWHSSQIAHPGLNLSQFGNRKADEAIEAARKTSDIETRKGLYEELVVIIDEVVPAVFLYRPTYTYVTAKKINGIDLESIISPADRFGQVSHWYIKTKKGFKR
ncbi:peptide ABC transporter substrate-binding protein [Candidatus Uhrbacteria bacterium]|nr:peptide ABC transporter substrate-binding protein [Candidatus Uhrbacteria bacterium]